MAARPSLTTVASGAGISQTTIIFGVLLFAFLVWVTIKGQLSAWGALFTTSAASSTSAAGSGATATPAATSSTQTSSAETGGFLGGLVGEGAAAAFL
jgi:hypothetical protein